MSLSNHQNTNFNALPYLSFEFKPKCLSNVFELQTRLQNASTHKLTEIIEFVILYYRYNLY